MTSLLASLLLASPTLKPPTCVPYQTAEVPRHGQVTFEPGQMRKRVACATADKDKTIYIYEIQGLSIFDLVSGRGEEGVLEFELWAPSRRTIIIHYIVL